ncbi:MAG: class I SAM-dependent methyltransferase [Thermoplasmata archaeon]|nr:class I SAM-dependent methyltransferase [Thermoplasmata archaeon]
MEAPDPGAGRVHPTARGFDRAADVYERARPEYPVPAMESIRDRLALGPGATVVDLAAGTGKLTRSLQAAFEVRIIAVEPSVGMRGEFLRAVPSVPILDGTAERIPLGDAVADAVVVGQAFHWFDPPRALAEIARVLRDRGGLALIWNHRDERVPWVERFGRVIHAVEHTSAPSARDTGWKGALQASDLFGPLEEARYDWVQRLTPKGLVERALSVSYVARLPEEGRAQVVRGVRAMLQDDPELSGVSEIPLPYVTELYWTHRRERSASADRVKARPSARAP